MGRGLFNVEFTLETREGGYYNRQLLKITNEIAKRKSDELIDRLFSEYGETIMSTVAVRMFAFLRDVNGSVDGDYPVYTGGYLAEKFGGLFMNPKIKALTGTMDLSTIQPYGEMLNQGRRASSAQRKEAVSTGMATSRASFFIKRQRTGISGSYLMLLYKIPPYTSMSLKYAENVESTGWGYFSHFGSSRGSWGKSTKPYNINRLLMNFKAYVFGGELLKQQISKALREMTGK